MTRRSFAKRLAVFAIAAKFSMLFDLATPATRLTFRVSAPFVMTPDGIILWGLAVPHEGPGLP